MASFLSARNTRTDGYGGPREDRVRLPLEVFQAVRAAVSADFPVGCRYLSDDCIDGGNTVDDAVFFGVEFARAGMDFLSLSRGGKFEDAKQPKVGWAVYPYTGPSGWECMPTVLADDRRSVRPQRRSAHPAFVTRIRDAGLETPVVVAGGISTFDQAEGDPRVRRSGHRRRGAAVAGGSRLVPEDAPRTRRRGPPLLLHQLLRRARPDAQTGHVQAVGPRSAR